MNNKFEKTIFALSSAWGMAGVSVPIFNSDKELCFCLSTHTAKSRKDINDLKKILPIMQASANNLKKVLFKD